MSKPRRKFSPEFRRIAFERMLAGENISQLARDLDVLRKTLYEWKDAYIAELPGGWVKKIPVTKKNVSVDFLGAINTALGASLTSSELATLIPLHELRHALGAPQETDVYAFNKPIYDACIKK